MKSKDVYFFPILNIVSLILENRNFYQQKKVTLNHSLFKYH